MPEWVHWLSCHQVKVYVFLLRSSLVSSRNFTDQHCMAATGEVDSTKLVGLSEYLKGITWTFWQNGLSSRSEAGTGSWALYLWTRRWKWNWTERYGLKILLSLSWPYNYFMDLSGDFEEAGLHDEATNKFTLKSLDVSMANNTKSGYTSSTSKVKNATETDLSE